MTVAGITDDDRMFTVTGLPPRANYTFEVQGINTELFVLGATATLTVSTSTPQSELLTFTLYDKAHVLLKS